uniref:Secreted protein n=1 Tax=Steinernema glaseri TaxID=37863 RepID=A0A1I8AM87_9BILA
MSNPVPLFALVLFAHGVAGSFFFDDRSRSSYEDRWEDDLPLRGGLRRYQQHHVQDREREEFEGEVIELLADDMMDRLNNDHRDRHHRTHGKDRGPGGRIHEDSRGRDLSEDVHTTTKDPPRTHRTTRRSTKQGGRYQDTSTHDTLSPPSVTMSTVEHIPTTSRNDQDLPSSRTSQTTSIPLTRSSRLRIRTTPTLSSMVTPARSTPSVIGASSDPDDPEGDPTTESTDPPFIARDPLLLAALNGTEGDGTDSGDDDDPPFAARDPPVLAALNGTEGDGNNSGDVNLPDKLSATPNATDLLSTPSPETTKESSYGEWILELIYVFVPKVVI